MPSDAFSGALARFGPEVARGCAAHWELVKTWQKRINLTAIATDAEAGTLHYLDSLAVLDHWRSGESLLDMGSGAGFPGVPLAIARPAETVYLVEPRRKRASFLRTVRARLGLENVRVLEARSDDPPSVRADVVVTRATFSDPRDIMACQAWGERIIALRGPAAELGAVEQDKTVERVRYSIGGAPRIMEIFLGSNEKAVRGSI